MSLSQCKRVHCSHAFNWPWQWLYLPGLIGSALCYFFISSSRLVWGIKSADQDFFLPYGCRSCYNLWQKFPRTSSGCVIVEAFSESSQYDPFFFGIVGYLRKKMQFESFFDHSLLSLSLYVLFSSCTITKDHHRLRIVRNSEGKNCILRNYFSKKGLSFFHINFIFWTHQKSSNNEMII